jgi:hypothetical protein
MEGFRMSIWSLKRFMYLVLSIAHCWLFLMTGYLAYAIGGFAYAVLAWRS